MASLRARRLMGRSHGSKEGSLSCVATQTPKRRYYEMGPDYSVGGRPGYCLEDEGIFPPYAVRRLPRVHRFYLISRWAVCLMTWSPTLADG
jgi:hypothetical protein